MARSRAVPNGVGWGFRNMMVGLAAAAFLLPLSQLTANGTIGRAVSGMVSVIVRTDPSATVSVERTVRDLGGKVDRHLGVISGISAEVPAAALPALNATRGVQAVTDNARIKLFSI